MDRVMINKVLVTRRIGAVLEYWQTADGKYWVINPQKGWVEVPATSRALALAIAEANQGDTHV